MSSADSTAGQQQQHTTQTAANMEQHTREQAASAAATTTPAAASSSVESASRKSSSSGGEDDDSAPSVAEREEAERSVAALLAQVKTTLGEEAAAEAEAEAEAAEEADQVHLSDHLNMSELTLSSKHTTHIAQAEHSAGMEQRCTARRINAFGRSLTLVVVTVLSPLLSRPGRGVIEPQLRQQFCVGKSRDHGRRRHFRCIVVQCGDRLSGRPGGVCGAGAGDEGWGQRCDASCRR